MKNYQTTSLMIKEILMRLDFDKVLPKEMADLDESVFDGVFPLKAKIKYKTTPCYVAVLDLIDICELAEGWELINTYVRGERIYGILKQTS